MIAGSMGQRVVNPLATELRQYRATLTGAAAPAEAAQCRWRRAREGVPRDGGRCRSERPLGDPRQELRQR
ncbi:hypothetical protein APR08_002337 [Nocardia amikacinitolerans]|nr:hypothetical protein [Nocardia amikacinitolerans]